MRERVLVQMSKDTQQPSIIYRDDGVAQSFAAVVIAAEMMDADGLYWNQLIPLGKFFHPAFGKFETTEADAKEMIANLDAGLPGPLGVPIAQGPGHVARNEGAYGWIKKMELRDGLLWGGMDWNDDGNEAVSSGRLPYISPNWITSAGKHDTYKKSNIIFNAALCVDPFFFDQPELQVAASEYLAGDAAVAAAKQSRDEKAQAAQLTLGGDMMASEAVVKDARTKYEKANGEVTDEAWVELTKDFADDAAYVTFMAEIKEPEKDPAADPEKPVTPEDELATLRAENEAAAEAATDAGEKLKAAETRAEEAEAREKDVLARVEVLEGDKVETEVKQELAATVIDGKMYTPAAIEVLAANIIHPSVETATALRKYVEGNKGEIGMVAIAQAPGITATASTGELTGETWLEAKDIPEKDKKGVRAIAASQSIELEAAYVEYLKPQSR